ncbi:MAG: glycoside hydrolase family 3 C-terminal domain-containing protein, partial [Steroidobacteraceae bacterium]
AGMDAASPVGEVGAAIAQGAVSPRFFDRKIYHELVVRFRLGLYDHPDRGRANADVSTPAHRALAREIASAGAVLLKNTGNVLPLANVGSIAVLGADAGSEVVVMESGSAHVHVGTLLAPIDAIRARAGRSVRVSDVRGDLGVRPLPLVPTSVLSPPSGRGQGLEGVYFASPDYWAPVLRRIDPTIDFGADPHIPKAPPGTLAKPQYQRFPAPWSAKWTGALAPPVTGLYGFSLTGAGTAELYVNDELVAAIEQADFPRTVIGTTGLTKGQPANVLIKYDTAAVVLGGGIRLGWQPPNGRLAQAAAAAKQADVAIVFAGEQLGEGYDKERFALPGDENRLIEAVAAVNPRTVVVLNTSTPVAMPWIGAVAAVIEAWYPGAQAGPAIAALLFGDVDPSGRLPVTFPRTAGQGPATRWWEYPGNGHSVVFSEGVRVGYRWYDAEHQQPLFPFGYGLSYTTFEMSGLSIARAGASRVVRVSVRNTGPRAGAEVVQLYVGLPAQAGDPPRQLKGFERVALRPGEFRLVTLPLPDSALEAYDAQQGRWRLYPGGYTVMVGASSRDVRQVGRFTVAPDVAEARR